jgi:hypothetical protein
MSAGVEAEAEWLIRIIPLGLVPFDVARPRIDPSGQLHVIDLFARGDENVTHIGLPGMTVPLLGRICTEVFKPPEWMYVMWCYVRCASPMPVTVEASSGNRTLVLIFGGEHKHYVQWASAEQARQELERAQRDIRRIWPSTATPPASGSTGRGTN